MMHQPESMEVLIKNPEEAKRKCLSNMIQQPGGSAVKNAEEANT